MNSRSHLWSGMAFALAAGMMWGLVFIAPLLLPGYPAALLSVARYLAFGLIAMPLAWFDRASLRQLTRADWIEALKLAVVGNLLYYFCLAGAIQRAGAPLPTMLIGTLPVVIAICANLRPDGRDAQIPWRRMALPLLLTGAGIACVNRSELAGQAVQGQTSLLRYLGGAALALAAVACWTWYPLRNARWLRHHPGRNPRSWATAQGVATLPLALAGYLLVWGGNYVGAGEFAMPFGPRPGYFIMLMLLIGLLASWLGTLCWNEASQRLPAATAGQLIVFETLAALSYTYILRGQAPEPLSLAGIALLLAGVMSALRIRPETAAGEVC